MLDRIDIHIEVPAVTHEKLHEEPEGAGTAELREEVIAAHDRQYQRQGCVNTDLNIQSMERHCALTREVQALLNRAMDRLGLSARAYHRVIRLARTIADLAQCQDIDTAHIGEAIQLRCLDRRN